MPSGSESSNRVSLAALALLIAIAVVRVLSFETTTSQGVDEPGHLAAGLELLEKHTYVLDPLHPPLAREAMALPLYVAGERLPKFAQAERRPGGYTEVGNAILYGDGHYRRNLLLARCGVLPFLCLAVLCVFFWTKRLFGTLAACLAAFLFSTLPSVLAFSSMAYTDLPAMSTQFACLFAFALWLDKPTTWRTVFFGITAGLAISTKFTSFIYLPAAGLAMLLVRVWIASAGLKEWTAKAAVRFAAALVIAFVILWGSYGLSIGHLQEALEVAPGAIPWLGTSPQASLPTFQHFPGPLRNLAMGLLRSDPPVPAPDLLRGIQEARLLKQSAPASYLFGHERAGGWWFFFPVALALKTPTPFILLGIVGLVYTLWARRREWAALLPVTAATAVLIVTMFIGYKVGTRHVLVVLPLASILGGAGAAQLWKIPAIHPLWGRASLCLLLGWQTVSTVEAQSDFLAYFNELAPRDPSRALVKGCDLDCGQDIFKLSHELQARSVRHVKIAMWGTADLSESGLPAVEVLPPYQPVGGWIAVSVRSLRTGQVVFVEKGVVHAYVYPPDALSWVERYPPVARVGKTILLYYLPEKSEKISAPASQ